MPGQISERMHSREFSSGAFMFRYFIWGTQNEDEVKALVASESPLVYRGAPRGDIERANIIGHGVWEVDIPYTVRTLKDGGNAAGQDPGPQGDGTGGPNMPSGTSGSQPLEREWSFSTGGGTQRVYAALEHIADRGRKKDDGGFEDPPNHLGAINVTADGIEGTEIVAPNPEFLITKKLRQLTWGYFKLLLWTTARTNSKPWGMFDVDEVLMLGAEASLRDGDQQGWNLSCRFGYQPTNDEDIWIGKVKVEKGLKRGWAYMWTEYGAPQIDNKLRVRPPLAVHIERVYPQADFDKLQLL